ncbi:uncharacterized protein LOC131884778 [Tigriopus californicus]|uniref:uncharacterized protein LOC131884778 n=1 Tax=Tigriopus californicus TaxID=6832 RepID=UPI0027DAAC1C|nr:uncharacterized protein LOC131884778 [Tigriopus californicus]
MANARDLVRPETFKAESQTLDDYLDYFESVVGVNEWADAKAAGVLICCLGVGSRLLDDVGAADRGSFATLKASLRNSKAPHRLVEAGELKFMRKGASETPQDFRSRVARKVDVCYGDFAASKKKVLVLDNFVYGLPMEMRNAVLLHHPSKIEDAVTAAMMFDTIRPFNASNKGKPKVLSEPVKNAPFKANDSRESGGNVTNWNTVTCYKCQERGHKASECRNKRRSHVSVVSAATPRLYLDVSIFPNGTDRWLVDSGAAMSILPQNRYSVDNECAQSIVGVDGSLVKCAGTRKLGLYIGKTPLEHVFKVVRTSEGILGMDILSKIKATLDISGGMLLLPYHERIKLVREGSSLPVQPELPHDWESGRKEAELPVHVATNEQDWKEGDPLDYLVPISSAHFHPPILNQGDAWEEFGSKKEAEIEYVPGTRELSDKIMEQNRGAFEGSGHTNVGIHVIETTPGPPVFQRAYRIPEVYLEPTNEKIQQLIEDGYIQESSSAWGSPLVVVKKKSNGKIRLCVDMRKVNERTIPDRFPTPNAEDILNEVHGNVFSVLDCDREKTAFSFRGKLFEFTVMCFGHRNAPATWSRIIKKVVDGLSFVCAFFDDVVVFSETIEEHKDHLKQVFDRFAECNLRLNRDKCKLFCSEVDYWGHKISLDGISVSPKKIDAIKNFPRPDSFSSLKRWLGLSGYYRKFIAGFAELARPLQVTLRKSVKHFAWTDEMERSFNEIKKHLQSAPLRARPDYSKTFVLTCDASDIAIGVTLEQEGQLIEAISHEFGETEARWPSQEKEAYAIVFALKKWRHLLLARKFIMRTDCKSLLWLISCKDAAGKLGRWSMSLADYDLEFEHIAGKDNVVSDALSRVRVAAVGADLEEWRDATSKDEKIQESLPRADLHERDGFVVKMTKKGEKLVVPQILVPKMLRAYHDDPMRGHMGFNKTLERLMKRYTWIGMRKDVKMFCDRCLSSGIKHCPTSPFHPASDGLTGGHRFPPTQSPPVDFRPVIFSMDNSANNNLRQGELPLRVNNHDDLLEEAFRIASQIRPVARENIKKSQEKSKKNYDKAYHVEATPVTEKNFVMWLRPAPVARGGSQKLKPPFQGPYLVESVSDKTARISDQTGRCQSVNVDQLKITKVDDPHLGVLRKRGRPRKSGGGM